MSSKRVLLTDADNNQVMPITDAKNVYMYKGKTVYEAVMEGITVDTVNVPVDDGLDSTSTNAIQNKVVTEPIRDLEDRATNVETRVTSVETRATNLEQQANVNLPNTINNLTTRVNNLDGASGRVTNLESTMSGVSAEVNTCAKRNDTEQTIVAGNINANTVNALTVECPTINTDTVSVFGAIRMQSPNGTAYQITVNNSGQLQVTPV